MHKANIKLAGMFSYKNPDCEASQSETGEDVAKRLCRFLEKHTKALEGHTNLIFCHELVMRAFQYLLSRDPTVFDRIEYDNWAVVEWCGSLDAIKNI